MKHLTLAFFVLTLSPTLIAQTEIVTDTSQIVSGKMVFKGLRVQFGLNLVLPLKDEDQENPNIPDRFEVLEKRPSIAAFFDGSLGQEFDIGAGFSNENLQQNEFIFGLTYNYNEYNNKVRSSEQALGSVLKSRTFAPYIGYGSYYDAAQTVLFYGFIGPSFKTYEGNYSRGSVEYVTEYSNTNLFRMGGRMQVNGTALPSVVTFGLVVEIGKIEAESVSAYRDKELIESTTFSSNNRLSANSIIFTISGGLSLFN